MYRVVFSKSSGYRTWPLIVAFDTSGFFENAPCGLIVATSKGEILRANNTICHWLGYEEEQLIGKAWQKILLGAGAKVFHQTHMAPLLTLQGSVAELQLDMLTKHGNKSPMLINATRKLVGDLFIDELAIIEATDRKKYEKELLIARQKAEASLQQLAESQRRLEQANDALEVANKNKNDFIAILAHELRNPLAPIQNAVEIFQSKNLLDPELIWIKDIIGKQISHMTHLINDLMDISRLDQGRVTLRKEAVNLSDLIAAVADMTAAQAKAKRHDINVSIETPGLFVYGDPTRLTQIVSNVLTNAIKYTPDSGNIFLTLTKDAEGLVAIKIKDNGIGIAAEDLDNLFKIFSQLQNGQTRSDGGLGIGLSLVKNFVELHNGSVSVKSDGLGLGSEFTIRLPEYDGHIQQKSNQSLTNHKKPKKILIIDDNKDAVDTMEKLLDLHGFNIVVALTGEEGLRQFREHAPDVVLLDLHLPDISGSTVATTIRNMADYNDAKLVAITGLGTKSDIEDTLAAGFDVHLTKPVNLKTLLPHLN